MSSFPLVHMKLFSCPATSNNWLGHPRWTHYPLKLTSRCFLCALINVLYICLQCFCKVWGWCRACSKTDTLWTLSEPNINRLLFKKENRSKSNPKRVKPHPTSPSDNFSAPEKPLTQRSRIERKHNASHHFSCTPNYVSHDLSWKWVCCVGLCE